MRKILIAPVLVMVMVVAVSCALLAYPASSAAAVLIEDAVEISKNTTEVKELLQEHPDASAFARNETYGDQPCWEVAWWTKERVENELHYPNVVVWVDMETGEIFNVGIPKGDGKIYPVPVSAPIHDYITHGPYWIIGIAIIIAALIASITIIFISKRKRKRKQG